MSHSLARPRRQSNWKTLYYATSKAIIAIKKSEK